MEHPSNQGTSPAGEALPARRTFFAWLTYGLGAIAA